MKLQATVSDSLDYRGGVTFKFSSNGNILSRELHNKGTQHLFDIITQFLAGYDVSYGIPSYIDIFDGDNSILKHRVPLVGIVWGSAANSSSYDPNSSPESAKGYLKVTTTIMNDDKNPNISQLNNASIRLLDKNGETLCIVEDTSKLSELWNSVNSTTDGIIEWSLMFGNR